MRRIWYGHGARGRIGLALALLLAAALLVFSGCAKEQPQGPGEEGEHPPVQEAAPQEQPLQDGPGAEGKPSKDGPDGPGLQEQPLQDGPAVGQQSPGASKEQDPKEQDPKEQGEPALQQDPPKEPDPTTPSQQTEPAQPPQTAPDQPAQPVQSCTLVVECSTVLDHMDELDPDKQELIPSDGVLLQTEVVLEEGDTAYDVLERAAREANMHLESSVTPGYRSVYIEGIANLYEFDCGSLSGWIYFVNGESFSHSASQQTVQAGDEVAFRYTCDLGEDLK